MRSHALQDEQVCVRDLNSGFMQWGMHKAIAVMWRLPLLEAITEKPKDSPLFLLRKWTMDVGAHLAGRTWDTSIGGIRSGSSWSPGPSSASSPSAAGGL